VDDCLWLFCIAARRRDRITASLEVGYIAPSILYTWSSRAILDSTWDPISSIHGYHAVTLSCYHNSHGEFPDTMLSAYIHLELPPLAMGQVPLLPYHNGCLGKLEVKSVYSLFILAACPPVRLYKLSLRPTLSHRTIDPSSPSLRAPIATSIQAVTAYSYPLQHQSETQNQQQQPKLAHCTIETI